jgi:hypothetical protein
VPTSTGAARPSDALQLADELEHQGRALDAARALETIDRDQRDPMVDVRIVHLRHQAFAEFTGAPPADPVPNSTPEDRFPGTIGAPAIDRDDLTIDVLVSALHHHGCLIVRGLLSPAECAGLRSDIDDAFAAFDDRGVFKPVEVTAPWYARLELAEGFEPPDPLGTAFLRKGGGVYAPFSPRAFVDCREAMARAGLLDVVAQYLRTMPILSVNKFVLRRIGGGAEPAWHQDGSYLGVDTNAINLWLALSECGADTDMMGLEIVPGGRRELAEAGTYDAVDPRAVSQHVAEQLARESGRPIERPYFGPGDGILFDQFFIHRSDIRPLERERYAIESWFFTAQDYPKHLIPVVAG